MQIGQLGIIAITIKGVLRIPLDEDQYLSRLDLACRSLAEAPERDDPPAMSLHFACGAARISKVFVLVRDVEEVECVDLQDLLLIPDRPRGFHAQF